MDNKKATLELGTKPVGKLLFQYAMPAIVAMVASSLYNMVDSIFIGQGVGAMAISGLAITFPFMNLSGAIGAGIGVGASTYLSVKLGQKDYATAQKILGNSIVLKIITGILFGAICLVFLDPILRFFGATDNTIPYARDYMVIILLGNVFTHLYFGMNALLRAASKPRHAMYATIFTVVLNTALDPLFIYTFGMGIRGAALRSAYPPALCEHIVDICEKSTYRKCTQAVRFESERIKAVNRKLRKDLISMISRIKIRILQQLNTCLYFFTYKPGYFLI